VCLCIRETRSRSKEELLQALFSMRSVSYRSKAGDKFVCELVLVVVNKFQRYARSCGVNSESDVVSDLPPEPHRASLRPKH
jgi:hypothetical protein